jgi:uncharacterized protein (DUF2252 family)
MAIAEQRDTPVPPPPGASVADRAAAGRTQRTLVPRSSHADWAPAPDRRDPVDMVEDQAASRVPELIAIRHGRMLVSAFTFYRGAADLMAADLAPGPRTNLRVQLCGDAHLSNFGVFAAPDRRMVFSLNDFDESLPGPFEWDVKRMSTSFEVAGRDRGFTPNERLAVVLAATRAYREAMQGFARMRTVDIWYSRLDVDDIYRRFARYATRKEVDRFQANVAKAQSKDSLRAVSKLTIQGEDGLRILADPPIITPIEDLAGEADPHELRHVAEGLLRAYASSLSADHRYLVERYRYVDAARKVVGVGSVGTRAWIMLLAGRDDGDPLVLQAKEAGESVLEPYLGRSRYTNHGRRVVEGQRLMQSASDVLLGWLRAEGFDGVERDFYVRQLWDQKGSALVDLMRPRAMGMYANICGWTLARAHARSGDPIAIASYLGRSDRFDRAIAVFARNYADQNERDHSAVVAAVDSGRLAAVTGV